MSGELQVERQGRSFTDMVREELQEEGYQLEGLPGVMIYSVDGDTTYSGMLSSEEDGDYLSFEISVGREDLPVEDVRSYLEEFYTGQDSVSINGTKGTRGLYQLARWTNDDGTPQSFMTSFDADPVRQEEPKTGELRLYLTLYDSWENPEQTAMDSVETLNSTLQKIDRPELSEERLNQYWKDELQTYENNFERLKELIFSSQEIPVRNLDNLSHIEFEEREEVKPKIKELVDAYQHLRNKGWQPTVKNDYDLRATDHTLSAHGFSEEDFERQLEWIEDKLEVSEDDQEFTLEVH